MSVLTFHFYDIHLPKALLSVINPGLNYFHGNADDDLLIPSTCSTVANRQRLNFGVPRNKSDSCTESNKTVLNEFKVIIALYLAPCTRFMTDAARREHEALKKKVQPKLSLSLTGGLSRSSVSTPPRHSSGNLTPPVTPPITPSSSFRSSTPTGKHQQQPKHARQRIAINHSAAPSVVLCSLPKKNDEVARMAVAVFRE